jgi:FkbM family methyltransferase
MKNNFINCVFVHDNSCEILVPIDGFIYKDLNYCEIFMKRVEHEVIFRKIVNLLIMEKIIQGNIIDLGAWIGDNSIPWSKNIINTVYAIDPSTENCSFIQKLSEINDIKNIKILTEVITEKEKIVSTNDNLWHASFQSNESGENKINSTSLDLLYKNSIIENIDFIHLDVEGMERLVIEGSKNIIQDYEPIIIFEQHISWEDYIGLSNILKLKNYRVFLINEILPGCMPDCRNILAIPSKKNCDEIIKIINREISIDGILTEL